MYNYIQIYIHYIRSQYIYYNNLICYFLNNVFRKFQLSDKYYFHYKLNHNYFDMKDNMNHYYKYHNNLLLYYMNNNYIHYILFLY